VAYKRYFYKNGRKLGPYYYESYRDENGKVRKRYVGTEDPSLKKNKVIFKKDLKEVTPTISKLKLFILGVLVFVLVIIDLIVFFRVN
jgi:hypothetical protein